LEGREASKLRLTKHAQSDCESGGAREEKEESVNYSGKKGIGPRQKARIYQNKEKGVRPETRKRRNQRIIAFSDKGLARSTVAGGNLAIREKGGKCLGSFGKRSEENGYPMTWALDEATLEGSPNEKTKLTQTKGGNTAVVEKKKKCTGGQPPQATHTRPGGIGEKESLGKKKLQKNGKC